MLPNETFGTSWHQRRPFGTTWLQMRLFDMVPLGTKCFCLVPYSTKRNRLVHALTYFLFQVIAFQGIAMAIPL